MRDASVELAFHSIYGTPWMKRIGAARHARPQAHDINKFPHVQESIKKAKVGGYAEGIIRMLILLARARGSVRRDRLERSNQLLHSRPPFTSMTPEIRSHIIHEQTMIVEFAGADAITALPSLLKDPVDRYRALNFVLDISGPIEEMDAPTIAMFKRFQLALLTMAKDWREPEPFDATDEPGTSPPAAGGPRAVNGSGAHVDLERDITPISAVPEEPAA
jgi:hypothetical protein